jgi:iron complex outermembrane receptor protein
LFASATAVAQDSEGQLEEIIVTAEFRETDVQDTPIAITAVTGEMLLNRGQTDLYEVANQAPNVTLRRGGQARSGMTAYIRGIGQYDFIAALEPGVGIYVDDVYYAQLTGSLLELLDVDRVEVLRGPQGTLSGRNSIGGAIKLFTKQPGDDDSGFIRVGFGSYDQVDFRGAGGLTLVEDKLFARASAAAKTRDGYVDILDYGCANPNETAPSQRTGAGCKIGTQGSQEYASGRIQLLWQASDDLDVSFAYDYLNNKSGQAPGVAWWADRTAIEANPANPTLSLPDGQGGTLYYRDHIFVPAGPYRNPNNAINDPYITYGTTQDFNPGHVFGGGEPPGTVPVPWKPTTHPLRNYIVQSGASLRIDWQISDNMSFDSITAYREYDSWFTWDEDASPIGINQLDNRLDNWQFTQEFRLNGGLGDSIDYTLGAFYLEQESHYEARVNLNYALIDFIHGPDPTPADTTALFAHANWALTDAFNISAGVRYSEEYKSYTHLRRNPDGSAVGSLDPTLTPGPADLINIRLTGVNGLTAVFEDDVTDWRLAASWNLTDSSMIYGSASTGYKGGGVNPRPFFPQQLQTFNSETLTSYELGWKSTLFDNTLRLNAALFMTEYEDIQLVLSQCEVPTFIDPDGIAAPCLKPANVGDADIEGVEIEAEWLISDNFLIDASASFLDFQYTNVDALALVGSEIDPLDMIAPYTPEEKWALGAQYTSNPGSLGEFLFRIDANYTSEIYIDPTNRAINQIDAYTLVNAVARWTAPDEAWQIEAQWLNLTDEVYYLDGYDVSGSQGTVIMQPGLPQTFNLSFQKNF